MENEFRPDNSKTIKWSVVIVLSSLFYIACYTIFQDWFIANKIAMILYNTVFVGFFVYSFIKFRWASFEETDKRRILMEMVVEKIGETIFSADPIKGILDIYKIQVVDSELDNQYKLIFHTTHPSTLIGKKSENFDRLQNIMNEAFGYKIQIDVTMPKIFNQFVNNS